MEGGFDALRAVVVGGPGVVARFPGVVCVVAAGNAAAASGRPGASTAASAVAASSIASTARSEVVHSSPSTRRA